MRKIFYLLSFIALCTFFLSCDKDSYTPSPDKLLPSKMIHDGDWGHAETLFYYDNQNRLIRTEQKGLGEARSTNVFTYNESGELSSIQITSDTYDDREITFSRQGNTITAVTSTETRTITLNDSGLPVKSISVREEDGYTETIKYEFDSRGNIVRYTVEAPGSVNDGSVMTCKYDKRNGVYRHVNIPAWYKCLYLQGSTNNKTGSWDSDTTYAPEITITYNEKDYPVRIATVVPGWADADGVNTFEYIPAIETAEE